MDKIIILNATELGYQVIRSLGEKGIKSIVIYDQDKDEIGRHSKYTIESFKVPGFIENPEILLEFLLKKKNEWKGLLIVPTKDYTVEFLSKNKETLSKYYIIPTPESSIIQRLINKRTLYDTARKLGIGVPETFSPKTFYELKKLENKLRFPCLIKPGLGHIFFRKYDFKMIEVHHYQELEKQYRELTNDFTHDDCELTISEIISGPDSEQMVQYVSYIDRAGELLASMTSRKIRQDPPKYGQGRIVKSEMINGLDEMSQKLLKELGYFGFSEIEWKYDKRDNKFKLIEINPRFIFYIGLCDGCGINFPYIQYQDLVKNQKIRTTAYRKNVYWIHLYKDILHTVLHHHMEKISLKEYAMPYFKEKVFAVLNQKDLRPFFYQWRQHLINIIKKDRWKNFR